MDAYSYLGRDHVFANAQTGNLLLLGIRLSMGDFMLALRYLFPVVAFAFGIAAAEIMRERFCNAKHVHWRQAVLMTEAVAFLIVAFIPQSMNPLANSLISFACGAQVETFRKMNGSGVATTMCIGNLRMAVQSICNYKFTKNKKEMENGFLYFGIVGIFVIGAVIGNFFVRIWSEKAIIISAIFVLAGFVLMFIHKEN